MNSWQTIKRLLGDGGKVAIMENDEVKYVVLTMREYERLSGGEQQPSILPASHRGEQTESPVAKAPTEHPGSIRIEDLPL